DDGYDEISLTSDFSLFSQKGEARISPVPFVKERILQQDIYGGETIEDAANIFKNILEGKGTRQQNEVVITNSAFALQCATGKEISETMIESTESLMKGKALKVFTNLISGSI
ncbi:MAG: anthranilate phosphoribosyltransferase, partial [Bacteroidia bacterium]|nr:anthranilate phosphoribosyltransferase [Bacteroidia bacterium]